MAVSPKRAALNARNKAATARYNKAVKKGGPWDPFGTRDRMPALPKGFAHTSQGTKKVAGPASKSSSDSGGWQRGKRGGMYKLVNGKKVYK